MNKGYLYYNKEAKKLKKEILKKPSSIILYYAFMLIRLLSILIYPIGVMFNEGFNRSLSKGKLDIFESFNVEGKCFKSFIIQLLKLFILLTGLVIIVIPALALFYGSSLISRFLNMDFLEYILIIPFVVLVIFFVVMFLFNLAPINYILNRNKNVLIGEAYKCSVQTMKTGKTTLFVNALLKNIFVGLIILIPVIPILIAHLFNDVLYFVLVILGILLIFLALYLIPHVTIKSRIIRNLLFDDIAYLYAYVKTKNVNKEAKTVFDIFDDNVKTLEETKQDKPTVTPVEQPQEEVQQPQETNEVQELKEETIEPIQEEIKESIQEEPIQEETVESIQEESIQEETVESIQEEVVEPTQEEESTEEVIEPVSEVIENGESNTEEVIELSESKENVEEVINLEETKKEMKKDNSKELEEISNSIEELKNILKG